MDTRKPHPAMYSTPVLRQIRQLLYPEFQAQDTAEIRVLDPMAGTGKIHALDGEVTRETRVVTDAIEIEPEWAAHHPKTRCGDMFTYSPDDLGGHFNVVVTSPVYGNRMSDTFTPKDASKRRGYMLDLGRRPDDASSATLQWGDAYRKFHLRAWDWVWDVLVPGGCFILNVSDHIRDKKVAHVAEWHVAKLLRTPDGMVDLEPDWHLEFATTIRTDRLRHGANHQARVDGELVTKFRKVGS